MEPKKLFCQRDGAVYGIDRDPLTRLWRKSPDWYQDLDEETLRVIDEGQDLENTIYHG